MKRLLAGLLLVMPFYGCAWKPTPAPPKPRYTIESFQKFEKKGLGGLVLVSPYGHPEKGTHLGFYLEGGEVIATGLPMTEFTFFANDDYLAIIPIIDHQPLALPVHFFELGSKNEVMTFQPEKPVHQVSFPGPSSEIVLLDGWRLNLKQKSALKPKENPKTKNTSARVTN